MDKSANSVIPDNLPKWQRMPDIRPEAILDSALNEFQAKGFAGARMEDIARGAGLSKGALYLYFKSKDDIFKELIEQAIVPMAERIEALSQLPQEIDMQAVMDMIVDMAVTRLSQPKIAAIPILAISEAGKFPELAAYYRDKVVVRVLGALTLMIKQGQSEGRFRQDMDPALAAHSLGGGFVLQILKGHLFGQGEMEVENLRRTFSHHMKLVLRGLQP